METNKSDTPTPLSVWFNGQCWCIITHLTRVEGKQSAVRGPIVGLHGVLEPIMMISVLSLAVSPEAGEAVVSELIVPVPPVAEVERRGSITELV